MFSCWFCCWPLFSISTPPISCHWRVPPRRFGRFFPFAVFFSVFLFSRFACPCGGGFFFSFPLAAAFGVLHYDSNVNLFRTHVDELRYSYEVLISEPAYPRQLSLVTLSELRQAVDRGVNIHPFVAGILQGNLAVLLQIPPGIKDQPYFK